MSHHFLFHFRFNITGKIIEGFFNVNTLFSRCFKEFYAILNRQLLATLFCYLEFEKNRIEIFDCLKLLKQRLHYKTPGKAKLFIILLQSLNWVDISSCLTFRDFIKICEFGEVILVSVELNQHRTTEIRNAVKISAQLNSSQWSRMQFDVQRFFRNNTKTNKIHYQPVACL